MMRSGTKSLTGGTLQRELVVRGRPYRISLIRRATAPVDAPRLVIVSYLRAETNELLLRACIQSIRRFTHTAYELWVVDNNSAPTRIEWLSQQPDINLVLNRTTPFEGKRTVLQRMGLSRVPADAQVKTGSFANAVALEIAAQLVDPGSKLMFTMHSDTLVCNDGWLTFLMSRLDSHTRGAAVLRDRIRVNAMHVCGMLFDYQLFRKLAMNFFPDPPNYDVGDLITIRLREAGCGYYVCPNTYNNPALDDKIDVSDPLRQMHCAKTFNDNGDVIYLHLARGTWKGSGTYRESLITTADDWLAYARDRLFKGEQP
jgi:hypothetical protein